jgi:hypothetical protein
MFKVRYLRDWCHSILGCLDNAQRYIRHLSSIPFLKPMTPTKRSALHFTCSVIKLVIFYDVIFCEFEDLSKIGDLLLELPQRPALRSPANFTSPNTDSAASYDFAMITQGF